MVLEFFMDWVQTATVACRVDAANAMVRAFLDPEVDTDEREELEAALTYLLDDNAPTVRLEIAESFGAYAAAPRHIMNTLANDTTEIAIVVLSQSPVFHEAELVRFIQTENNDKQIAISCRPWLSEPVTRAICEFGSLDANLGLLMNPVSEFSDLHLEIIAERHGKDTEIRSMLLEMPDLPGKVRHILIGKLGEALAGFVSSKAWLPKERAEFAVGDACDKASIIFSSKVSDNEVSRVVQNLIENERVSVAFLLRAICMGNISLVANAFAQLSGVKVSRVESILMRDQRTAFKALYKRAGLPGSAYIVFQTAITTWKRLSDSGSSINQSRLPFLVTREILEAYSGKTDAVVDELLVLLRRLSAEIAREHSKARADEKALLGQVENGEECSNTSAEEEPEIGEMVEDAEVIEEIEIDFDFLEAEVAAAEEADIVADEIRIDEPEMIVVNGIPDIPVVRFAAKAA